MSLALNTDSLTLRKRKVIIAGICALILTVGIARFAYTPFLPLMLEQAGLSTLAGGWLATFNYVGYLFGILLIAWLSDLQLKFRLYRLNLMLAVLSTIGMGLTSNVLAWSVLRLVAGMSSTAGIILAAGFVMTWLKRHHFPGNLGLHFSGLGLGIALPGMAIALIGDQLDWAMQWIVMGLFGVIFFIPAWRWMPAPASQPHDDTTFEPAPSRRWMNLMIAAYFCAGVGYVISATFIVAILENMPALAEWGNWIWVVLGLTAVPSCVVWDKMAERFGEASALLLSYSILLLSILIPAISHNLVLNVIGAMLFGGTFAGIVSLMLVFIGHQFPHNPARAMAKLTISYGIAQITAPALAGHISTLTGSYLGALWLAILCMPIGILCLWCIRRTG